MDKTDLIIEKIRESLLPEFEDIKKRRDDLSANDLEYYLARDRKAAIILKTIDMDMRRQVLALKAGGKKQLK
jgi:hypothetical protein